MSIPRRLTWLHTPDWDGVVSIAAYSVCIVCAQCVYEDASYHT